MKGRNNMKRNIKSLLAVCLIVTFLIPTLGLKNRNKANSNSKNVSQCFCVDPFPEL